MEYPKADLKYSEVELFTEGVAPVSRGEAEKTRGRSRWWWSSSIPTRNCFIGEPPLFLWSLISPKENSRLSSTITDEILRESEPPSCFHSSCEKFIPNGECNLSFT
ncbi:hypothetical protein Leryth_019276 [Lithospermum erythrorhizon]|nr:hypothetical protein Leryth_019276 [Lithospermum erythrorhizon]